MLRETAPATPGGWCERSELDHAGAIESSLRTLQYEPHHAPLSQKEEI